MNTRLASCNHLDKNAAFRIFVQLSPTKNDIFRYVVVGNTMSGGGEGKAWTV